MSGFHIIVPRLELAPYVKQYTLLRVNRSFYAMQRVLPMGCVELMMYKVGGSKRNHDWTDIPRFFVGGNRSGYLDLTPGGGEVHYISILFQPYGARSFFNFPIDEFYNRIVTVEDIGDESWRELCNRITDASDLQTDITLIENFLLKKLHYPELPHLKRIIHSIDTLYAVPDVGLVRLAEEACLSQKQFKRVFQNYVGCNPKEFMRIVRFNRVLRALKAQKPINFAQIAQEYGYSDQSHFIREFKVFSGYTPLEFLTSEVGLHHFS